MFLSRVGTRVSTKVSPAVATAVQKQGLAPVAAASPLFFTEFADNKPTSESVFFWAGSMFEEQFQKNVEPNVELVMLGLGWVVCWRLAVHFGIAVPGMVREAQLKYGVRWQPGHHRDGPWKAVNHPLISKKN